MTDPREFGTSVLEGRGISSSSVWCRRKLKDLILSLKNAKRGPMAGTQATVIETFSSTLERWSVPMEAGGGKDKHSQYDAIDSGICIALFSRISIKES